MEDSELTTVGMSRKPPHGGMPAQDTWRTQQGQGGASLLVVGALTLGIWLQAF